MEDSKLHLSSAMQDYLKQYEILVSAEDRIMNECSFIYPAVDKLHEAIQETIEAIKWQAVKDIGGDVIIEKITRNAKTNLYWDWNEDFKKWRKERGGRVAQNRNDL